MNPDELMTEIGGSYLWLNIPDIEDSECRQEVENILCVERLATARTVAELLTFTDWRERLVGHVLAVRKGPRQFASAMLDSLADPRGYAIVPTCAALVLALADDEPDQWMRRCVAVDRSPFDGDVGWSLDKMAFHLGWSTKDPGGHSPNDGKDFYVHLALFRWVTNS